MQHTTIVTKLSRLRVYFFSSKSIFSTIKIFFLFRHSVARAKIGTQLHLASLQGGESGCSAVVLPGAQPVQELTVPNEKLDL